MYALIENHCVIRVFESIGGLELKQGQTVCEMNEYHLFYLKGGDTAVAQLIESSGEFVVDENGIEYPLQDVDGFSLIGKWSSF